MSLDKSSILNLLKPQIIKKPVTGFGEINLVELSAPQVTALRDACKDEATKADFGFRMVIASVVDEQGELLFKESDLPELRASAQSRIGELVSAVMEANGFSISNDAVKT